MVVAGQPGLCWLVELNFVLGGGTVGPMAPTLLLGHGQYIIVTIVIVVRAIVIVIAISIIIKNIEAFLLRQSVHIKLAVRVTTGAHLDKKLSIKIEMKGEEKHILIYPWMKLFVTWPIWL